MYRLLGELEGELHLMNRDGFINCACFEDEV